jgi:hypothetical protein
MFASFVFTFGIVLLAQFLWVAATLFSAWSLGIPVSLISIGLGDRILWEYRFRRGPLLRIRCIPLVVFVRQLGRSHREVMISIAKLERQTHTRLDSLKVSPGEKRVLRQIRKHQQEDFALTAEQVRVHHLAPPMLFLLVSLACFWFGFFYQNMNFRRISDDRISVQDGSIAYDLGLREGDAFRQIENFQTRSLEEFSGVLSYLFNERPERDHWRILVVNGDEGTRRVVLPRKLFKRMKGHGIRNFNEGDVYASFGDIGVGPYMVTTLEHLRNATERMVLSSYIFTEWALQGVVTVVGYHLYLKYEFPELLERDLLGGGIWVEKAYQERLSRYRRYRQARAEQAALAGGTRVSKYYADPFLEQWMSIAFSLFMIGEIYFCFVVLGFGALVLFGGVKGLYETARFNFMMSSLPHSSR